MTTSITGFDVCELRNLYRPDQARLELARARQHAIWAARKPDARPIIMGGKLTAEQEQIPAPDIHEAFHDSRLMLCQQMRAACALVNGNSDGIPSIRANTGTATLMACCGLEQEVHPGQMPWLQQHLTVEQARNLTPNDIKIQGTFAKALEHIKFFREIMGDAIDIYCVDTQGPFDLAHLLIGDEIFYVIHDDPEGLHQIMNFCTDLYIRCTEEVKKVTGEDRASMSHSNGLSLPNAGVRICEDTTTLIGRDAMLEFVIPYTRRAAAHFNGGWIHFCGRNDSLAELLCQCPEVVGLNFGVIPGKEDDFDFDRIIPELAAHGKIYYDGIPKKPDETGKDYLRRLHRYAETGCFIADGNPSSSGKAPFENTSHALDFWYSLG